MNEKYIIYKNEIEIKYSSPENEISEDFDYIKKSFYITIGVENLFIQEKDEYKNNIQKRVIAGNLINRVYEKAKNEKLDYFLKILINGTETWLIDNGNDICLMLPEEY